MLTLAWIAVSGAALADSQPGSPWGSRSHADSDAPLRVAAASSLRTIWPALAATYRETLGPEAVRVAVTFGASSTLMRQIRAGAPFALFLSADERQIERLARAGLTHDTGRLYALGTLSLVLGERVETRVPPTLAGLLECVTSGLCRRIAIANPGHAPYGIAAWRALRRAGIWSALEPRLVRGDSAAQALQYVLVGAADAALVPSALLSGDHAATRLASRPLDRHQGPTVRHRLVRLRVAAGATRRGADAAARLEAFLVSPAARTVWQRFGFAVPDS